MGLIGYRTTAPLAPVRGQMFDYVMAGNGVFIEAKRDLFSVLFPVSITGFRDLPDAELDFHSRMPLVPMDMVLNIRDRFANFANENLEDLVHLIYSPVYPYHNGWELVVPDQVRTSGSCRPNDPTCESARKAVIEIHSHHLMPARFSPQDDIDEQGFKIYAVVGGFGYGRTPMIRMRVGVYGYFWEIPSPWLMELPEALDDVVVAQMEGEASYA